MRALDGINVLGRNALNRATPNPPRCIEHNSRCGLARQVRGPRSLRWGCLEKFQASAVTSVLRTTLYFVQPHVELDLFAATTSIYHYLSYNVHPSLLNRVKHAVSRFAFLECFPRTRCGLRGATRTGLAAPLRGNVCAYRASPYRLFPRSAFGAVWEHFLRLRTLLPRLYRQVRDAKKFSMCPFQSQSKNGRARLIQISHEEVNPPLANRLN